MRRLAASLVLGIGGLLLTPGAPGVPTVPGDPSPPLVVPVITGTLGNAGWYTSNVTVSWSITDPESIILSTTGCDTRTLSSDTAGTPLTCSAASDGGETTVTKTFKVDKTPPSATATPTRPADVNGWYNHELTVDFVGDGGTSGPASCSPVSQLYQGPDTTSATLVGTCRDPAGNTASASVSIKYDETAPAATPSTRPPDANGWYNQSVTVIFQGADATSGVGQCTQMTYSGPDDPSVAFQGTCTDRAGNESNSSVFTLSYDETAPVAAATASRPADVNGWYNRGLTVSFAGSDAMSGQVACDAAKAYSGPDSSNALVRGSCRDHAGNVASPSVSFPYDGTPPTVATTPSRNANALGWYTAPLTVRFTGSDPISGVASCDADKSYPGPDSAAAAVTGNCRDNAGNSASGSFPLKYDATAPQVTSTPSAQPNAHGWHKAPFSVSFAGADATAGIDSCDAAKSYSGPDRAAESLSGSCRDRAGNSTSSTFNFKYDATQPTVTATAERQPNANGWYTAPLAISFTGGDAMSGLESCDGPQTYSGPDTLSVSVGGGCRDKAGNVGAATVAVRYDATAPQATVTPSRQPNANGWYNAALSVGFAWSDGTSGTGACETARSYSGPDNASATVSAACADLAGNVRQTSFPLRYDATAPSTTAAPGRAANANGWYNAPLAVSFTGADQTSGVDACDAAKTYSSSDNGAASLSGSCRDRAGNSSASTFAFKYDATAPVVTQGIAVRAPDRAGWYNRPVAFAVQGTDATSGIDSCPAASYSGPDSATASFSGACLDEAGNLGTKPFPLAYDGTGPQVTASPSRGADANGWYNQPLTVAFAGSDAVSGLESCAPPESYGGPDSAAAVVGGICTDKAGNVGVASVDLHYDSTPPQVTGASPNRPPDAGGWYNHPLVVAFVGNDSTSEIEACTQARYAGPDAGAASVSGSCRDRAGNGSPAVSFTLKYDATPPTLTGLTARAGNGSATIGWTASADTTLVEIRRAGALVYRGAERSFTDTRLRNGVRYRYSLTGYDEARNAATAAVVATPTAPLLSPAAGARVSAPPLLVWKAAAKASYYNVQVWRRGRIFSAWPKGTSLRLKRTWIYHGRRYRLTPGRYRWYVWPGFGRRAQKKFGPALGSSTFVVR